MLYRFMTLNVSGKQFQKGIAGNAESQLMFIQLKFVKLRNTIQYSSRLK